MSTHPPLPLLVPTVARCPVRSAVHGTAACSARGHMTLAFDSVDLVSRPSLVYLVAIGRPLRIGKLPNLGWRTPRTARGRSFPGCHVPANGGVRSEVMTECDSCPRSVCSKCIPNAQLSEGSHLFYPYCHVFHSNSARKNLEPYIVSFPSIILLCC
jgi:hypothetical protein